ncbi:MAG: cell division protein FtsQ/DivIB [Methylococcaceae bacterium]|nr:cell division protein FtsQ/DivIB [Methylococcaceae bacterium]MDZ4098396.1 cell division protein FtsQ/DivIB [Methylophilaceae bacterium]MDZ4157679.1 cell division protein FtsQ/DivIB [Methylococcales bacterium]MDP2393069.1 cell division protein FtsQ/DivIB [Methylococcaceae bacterium]MDP3019213.1 cell division protein FtsQ/DivIB [Methylococcaceae bacterium]
MQGTKLVVAVLVLAGLSFGIKQHVLKSKPIKYVRTEGSFQYLGKEDVKNALLPLVSVGFFDADMQAIQQAVGNLTWVESVTVKRVWPDAIDIKVREKKPYVRWRKNSLVDTKGQIIEPKSIEPFSSLLLVYGPDQQQVKVLEIMKGVKTALADKALELAEFSVNDRWAWKIKLTTGMEILLGRQEQLKNLQRFLKTLDALGQERVDAIAVVDLRYPNGYAVSWKPEAEPIDWKAIANPQSKTDG